MKLGTFSSPNLRYWWVKNYTNRQSEIWTLLNVEKTFRVANNWTLIIHKINSLKSSWRTDGVSVNSARPAVWSQLLRQLGELKIWINWDKDENVMHHRIWCSWLTLKHNSVQTNNRNWIQPPAAVWLITNQVGRVMKSTWSQRETSERSSNWVGNQTGQNDGQYRAIE